MSVSPVNQGGEEGESTSILRCWSLRLWVSFQGRVSPGPERCGQPAQAGKGGGCRTKRMMR
jgi:hypothetical protein